MLKFDWMRYSGHSRVRHGALVSALLGVVAATVMSAPVVAQDAQGIDEIVVTARKRTEVLRSVPAAITVVSADDIAANELTTSPEIAALVPGLVWQSILGYSTPNIFLRGIGNATFNANQASPVGIHRDGVYQGSSVTYGFGLYDLERIEVLKGPQGTLFGRNTTGGVINFVTRKPDAADGVNGTASATYGRFNQTDFEGAFGAPLGERVAVRIAGQKLYRDGYVMNRNAASGIVREGTRDMWSARGQLAAEADAVELLLDLHGGHNQSDVTPGKQLGIVCPAGVTVPRLGQCTDFLGFRDTTDLRENFTNIRSIDDVETWGASGTATWKASTLTIVSQTAFDTNRRRFMNDSDSGPYTEATTNAHARYRQFSQEVRVLSEDTGPLNWIAGANYYTDDLKAFTAFNLMHLGPGALSQFFPVPEGAAAYLHQKTKSYAGFGEANYEVAPRLTLTAGVRWTHDKREANTDAHIFNATGFETTFIDETLSRARLLVPTIPAMTVTRAWSRWSGRGVASYEVSENLLGYVQVAHGFKGGDFNGGALFGPAEANIVNPEYVLSTEAGLKGVAANGLVSFDLAAFRYGFSDQQVSVLVPASRATLQQLSNAAKTRVTGLDAEVQVHPTEALVFEARANLLDAQFTRFVFDSENPASNLAGKRPAFSPKVSFYGAARYTVPVRTGEVALQVDTSHKSAHFFTVNNIPALQQPGLWLFNASTRYAAADDHYSVAVWVKNIFDTDYFATGLANSALGFMELIPGPPRSFGVTLSAGF